MSSKKALRIVIVTPFYPPSIGGVEYIVYHTARELARRGLEVHVVTTTCDNQWKKVAEPGIITEGGVVIHRLEPSWIRVGYAAIMKGLKETLWKLKPDIVHAHNLHPHLFQAMKWKDQLSYKLVAQLHHPTATGIDHLAAKALYKPVMWNLVRNQHKVDTFIAHTRVEKQWLINEGIDENRVHIIRYPCIPDELFNYKPTSDIHDKLGADKVITYISRIHPRKGQHLLIQAAKHLKENLKDFKVYIAGPTSNHKYLAILKNIVAKHNLENIVTLDPRPLPDQEKLDAIASSDVFALTSLNEYTPVTILEALALNTPVIATNVGAIPELLTTSPHHNYILGKLVYTTPPQPQKIADALKTSLLVINKLIGEQIQQLVFSYKLSVITETLLLTIYRNLKFV